MEKCIRCGSEIPLLSKSKKYCSLRCSILYLKKQYRERNRKKIQQYKYKWRKYEVGNKAEFWGLSGHCNFCGSTNLLLWHHITYKPELVVRLCKGCHQKLHKILKLKYGKEAK